MCRKIEKECKKIADSLYTIYKWNECERSIHQMYMFDVQGIMGNYKVFIHDPRNKTESEN